MVNDVITGLTEEGLYYTGFFLDVIGGGGQGLGKWLNQISGRVGTGEKSVKKSFIMRFSFFMNGFEF